MLDRLVTGAVQLFWKICGQWFSERLFQRNSRFQRPSQMIVARQRRLDEQRTRILAVLHTHLESVLRTTDSYVASCDAGNEKEFVDELRATAIQTWVEFREALKQAEIFLPTELACQIGTYGRVIADTRVKFEEERRRVSPHARLEERLGPLSKALGSLSKIRTDIRPELIKVIRSAIGSDSIDAH